MKKSGLLLLLAVAFGCAETVAPPAPESSTASESLTAVTEAAGPAGSEAAASPETQEADGLDLPPVTATLVKFSCPGMT